MSLGLTLGSTLLVASGVAVLKMMELATDVAVCGHCVEEQTLDLVEASLHMAEAMSHARVRRRRRMVIAISPACSWRRDNWAELASSRHIGVPGGGLQTREDVMVDDSG